MTNRKALELALCVAVGTLSTCAVFAKDLTTSGPMSTASKQDIINTMRSKGAFHRMLQGMEQTYELDNELKGKGPYTVFAADDKAWAKINQADQDTLFGNKKKLDQVLRYEVIKGKALDSKALQSMKDVQTLEGQLIKISSKDNDKKESELWLNNSRVKTADIECSNGILHIVDAPLMPPLAK